MKEAPIMFSIRILKAVYNGKTNKTGMMAVANIPGSILNKYLTNLLDNNLVKREEVKSRGFSGGVRHRYTITSLGVKVIVNWNTCLSKMGLSEFLS